MKSKKPLTIALAGNPNTGKSTIFNALAGQSQKVGNWPGKTVEKRWGKLKISKKNAHVTDLPGAYSLCAYSPEEEITRDFIVEKKPDVIINIVDASNLERNLYFTVQLIELGANVVVALNMADIAQSGGHKIDVKGLSRLLGVPVVPTVARKGEGIGKLVKEALKAAKSKKKSKLKVNYGKELEPKIAELEEHIKRHAKNLAKKYGARWIAIRLIEKDREMIREIKKADTDIYDKKLESFIRNAGEIYGDNTEIEISDRRYGLINGIVKNVVQRTSADRLSASDKIDSIATNRWLGIPIFLLLMYIAYQFVFVAGEPFADAIGYLLGAFADFANAFLVSVNSPDWLSSLVVLGIIEGIGNVIVFLPNIAFLFLAIAVLEDSGYMARAAFVMDRPMRMVGLHGKSFISMVVAFGCNVPAIMSTRTLENWKDRMVTIIVNSMIPCSARMVVFVFLAGAFFAPEAAGQVVWSLVVLALVLAMASAWLLGRFVLRGKQAPFVMELPPYQIPTLKGIVLHTWARTKDFVHKAGTFIFLVAILIWFLASNPAGVEYGSAESYIGMLGRSVSPLFAPLGFDWIASIALVFGLLAKEVVISAFAVLYGVSDEGALQQALAISWSPLQAYVFMVFTLLYIPCFATIAVIKSETGSWKWTLFALAYTFALAWVVSLLVLHIGLMLGFG